MAPHETATQMTRALEVELVVPVYNEAASLARSIRRLHGYLAESFPFSYRVTIADNGSTDDTWTAAVALADELSNVRAVRIDAKGRGLALYEVWSTSEAKVLAYTDVDLSTDLSALLPLVAPLLSGHSELAIGSRLAPGSNVVRGPKRELISRAYNAILHIGLGVRFSDAQCGFKAIRADCARQLLPLVRDRAWFFDTELLVLAERAGMRIYEVPVDWTDDPDSRVDIVSTALADLRGTMRLARARRWSEERLPSIGDETRRSHGESARFAGIGAASTVAYLGLFFLLRVPLGVQGANALALLVTASGAGAASHRPAVAPGGRERWILRHLPGFAEFLLALAVTSSALALLEIAMPHAGPTAELSLLVATTVLATLIRFLLLRARRFPAFRAAPGTTDATR